MRPGCGMFTWWCIPIRTSGLLPACRVGSSLSIFTSIPSGTRTRAIIASMITTWPLSPPRDVGSDSSQLLP